MDMTMTRRALLRMSPLATIAMSAPALALATPATEEEDPALVAAGVAVQHSIAVLDAALERKSIARAAYEKLAPEVPAILVAKGPRRLPGGTHALGCVAEREQDCEGNIVWPVDPARSPRDILTSHLLREELIHYDGRTATARSIRAAIKAADEYEAAVEAALETSGINNALAALCDARQALSDAAKAVLGKNPQTPRGLVIIADALLARRRTQDEDWMLSWTEDGATVADAVRRICGDVQ